MQPKNYSSKKFQFEKCIDYLHKAGKSEFGNHFRIFPADYEIIFKILAYFFEDEKLCEQYKLSIRKGLLLTGPVGCGKNNPNDAFSGTSSTKSINIRSNQTREIFFTNFSTTGFSIINKYSKAHFQHYQDQMVPRTLCLDDLGLESTIKHFGNENQHHSRNPSSTATVFSPPRGMIYTCYYKPKS